MDSPHADKPRWDTQAIPFARWGTVAPQPDWLCRDCDMGIPESALASTASGDGTTGAGRPL